MPKAYITSLLFKVAVDLAKASEDARRCGLIEKEIRMSMTAHLVAALCLEGGVNEVGEQRLGAWFWERAEKLDPAAKWLMVSKLVGNGRFGPDREPVQTVHELQKARNLVAHPKGQQQSPDVIIRHTDGHLDRNPRKDLVLDDGDAIYQGYGPLLDEFNASSAARALERTLNALRQLKQSFLPDGLAWVDSELDHDW